MIAHLLFALALLGFSGSALADESVIVEDQEHKFEVKVDKKSGKVDVFTLKSGETKQPRKMSLSLLKNESTGETIELRAVGPQGTQGASTPQFQGSLGPFAGSYIGIELQFSVNKKTWKRLRGSFSK